MYKRAPMGNVKTWEVVLSLGILTLSTMLIGILASKIYRIDTLRYDNPIKLRNVFKRLKGY